MINIIANGSGTDYKNGLARASVSANEGEEEKVMKIIREAAEKIQSLYGTNSIHNLAGTITADHGGAEIRLALTVTNYPDSLK